jgi:hypothetical protein
MDKIVKGIYIRNLRRSFIRNGRSCKKALGKVPGLKKFLKQYSVKEK